MTIQTLQHPFTRVLAILPAASLVTLAILFSMHLLVHNNFDELVEQPDSPTIMPFINDNPRKIKTIFDDLIKPVKPLSPQTPPVLPDEEPLVVKTQVTGHGIGVTQKPVIGPGIDISTDSQVMPFIKVQPNYPSTATMRGIEGYVDVVFDVTATGATENIRIVNAVPSSIFNRSVMEAIKRWKYKPKLIEGVPQKSFDVQERITFQLDNA